MEEMRKQFHEELEELRSMVARAAAMVIEVLPRGTAVLLGGDLQGARTVVEGDDELDLLSLEIEEEAVRLVALQQPMASDLRLILAALKLNGEIERSGDLVVNVAKAARRLHGSELTPRCRGIIQAMSEEAAQLFRLALDAYLEGDAALAAALDDMDDRLDELNKELVEAIFEAHREGAIDLPAAVQLALISRYYERIGDHAVNVGDVVQFMVTGWLPEHTGAARARARREADGADRGPVGL